MRDAKRIDPFLEILSQYWKQEPDMRFGRLIFALQDCVENKYNKDFFNTEDFALAEILVDEIDVVFNAAHDPNDETIFFDKLLQALREVKENQWSEKSKVSWADTLKEAQKKLEENKKQRQENKGDWGMIKESMLRVDMERISDNAKGWVDIEFIQYGGNVNAVIVDISS